MYEAQVEAHISMKQSTVVMIAAKPGIMRNSLQAYLRTLNVVQDILLADDAIDAFRMVCAHDLGLMIVDADLSESEMLGLVRQTHVEKPAMRIVALVTSLRQRQMCLTAGADYGLLKGFLDEHLGQIVMSTLPTPQSTSPQE